MVIHTSLSILKVLLTSLWLSPPFAVLFSSPDHVSPCCTFTSLGHAIFPIHLHYFISSSFLLVITPCPLLSSTWYPWLLYLSHTMYDTTTSFVYYPNSSRHTSSGTSLPQCSFALLLNSSTGLLFYSCCASCGLATRATSPSSIFLTFLSCASPFIECTSLSSNPHTWSTWPLLLLSSLLSSFLLHTVLPYFSTPQTYFWESLSPFLPLSASCNFRPGARISYNAYTTSLFFLLILPSVWWGSIFLWASCSSMSCIDPETLCYYYKWPLTDLWLIDWIFKKLKKAKFRQAAKMLLSLRSNPQTMSPYIHNCDGLCTSTDHHLITTYYSTYGSVFVLK